MRTLFPQDDDYDLDAVERLTVPGSFAELYILESNSVDHIDSLNIDVEGTENAKCSRESILTASVRSSFWLRRRRPSRLELRSAIGDPTHMQWEPLLLSKGYLFSYFDGLNRFYVRRRGPAATAAFSLFPWDRYATATVRMRTSLPRLISATRLPRNEPWVELLSREIRRLREERERLATAFSRACCCCTCIVADRHSKSLRASETSVAPFTVAPRRN